MIFGYIIVRQKKSLDGRAIDSFIIMLLRRASFSSLYHILASVYSLEFRIYFVYVISHVIQPKNFTEWSSPPLLSLANLFFVVRFMTPKNRVDVHQRL